MELARYPWQRIAARAGRGHRRARCWCIILALSMLGFAALFSASYENPGRVLNQLVIARRRADARCGSWRRSRRRR